jgi:hypothetical protein
LGFSISTGQNTFVAREQRFKSDVERVERGFTRE